MMWNRPLEDTLDYVAEHGFDINGTTYSFEDCMTLARVCNGALVPDRLANHPDPRVRLALAPSADKVVTKYLLEDPDDDVRAAAQKNPAIGPRDLEDMAKRGMVSSRVAAASHPRVIEAVSPVGGSKRYLSVVLAKDDDMTVRCALGKNEALAAYDLAVMMALAWDNDSYVRAAVASNPSTPVDLLVALADDEFEPATPQHIREHLAVEFG
jgi:hypothetical protein